MSLKPHKNLTSGEWSGVRVWGFNMLHHWKHSRCFKWSTTKYWNILGCHAARHMAIASSLFEKKSPRMNSYLNIHQTVTFSEWRGMKVCGFNMFQMWQFWLFNIPVRKCVFLLHKIYNEQYIHLNSNKKFHYKWQLFLYIHFQWLLVWLILFQKQCTNLLSMFFTLR